MKIVQAAEKKWLANQLRHRKGNILIKDMLEGEDGSPENYKFFLSKESADFYSPRHRHPWDQIRFCLDGSVPIGSRKSVDQGEIGYFPDFGTVGLVLRNPKLENFTATELLDLSHKMVDVMDIGGDIRANVNIGKGGITMGYFPHDIVMSKQLR